MAEKITTITDMPREGANDKDSFGLTAYEMGLETFLRNASTPITVALQGEWGSGKTSLMNVLRDNLSGKNNTGDFFHVWINTWEYSLMRDSNEALLQILYKMADEVFSLYKTEKELAFDSIKKNIIRLGFSVTRGLASKITDGVSDEVIKAFSEEAKNNISDLRNELQKQINLCFEKTDKKILFFLDDLDRIDPPVAVELLELLKNIFTLKHCIFILAIDYDVVIKGLKPKFGELNDKNEREFRSFFDKIIQVPFSMPVSQYSTEEYLIGELKGIGILASEDSHDKSLTDKLNIAERLTVGHNPRSIKRFLNTLSLIKCINVAKQENDKESFSNQEKEDDKVRKLNILLNLAIVGIQVAYPKVYQLLCIEPDFTKWDDKIASKMGIPSIDEQIKERLKKFNEFDDPWEQVLYRLCLTDSYLHNNAVNISQLFNMILEEINKVIPEDENESTESEDNQAYEANTIRDLMQCQMSQASITNFAAGDSEQYVYDPVQLMRYVQGELFKHVQGKYKGMELYMARVTNNGGKIKIKGSKSELRITQNRTPDHKILFHFHICSLDIANINFTSGRQFIPEPAPLKHFHDEINKLNIINLPIFSDYKKVLESIASNDCYRLYASRHADPQRGIWFNLNFDVTFDNAEAFREERSLKTMMNVTRIFFDIIYKLSKIR